MRFCLTLLFLFASTCCHAQQMTAQSLDPIVSPHRPVPEVELSRFKKQALQSLSLSSGYMGDVGGSGLSSTFLDLSIGSGIPLGSFDNILGVTPRFRVDWVDADASLDIPSELYEFELQFFYRRPIHDRLSAMAIVSPSVRSDLSTSEDALRVFALGLLNWQWIPDRLTLSGGAVYLGRADIPVVPAIGIDWTPNRITKLELRFPTSKFARRLAKDGGRSETWAYVTAGLGGNTWAITRRTMQADEISLRYFDLRSGIEKIVDGGGGYFADAGYAFSRRLEYESDETETTLNDAILFRAGWRY
ncbi:MAG: hypothetical protein HKN47_05235 [Pirellulaceae bacterium]|nr:hypothetical protein [Pirellulaceae bacterium]